MRNYIISMFVLLSVAACVFWGCQDTPSTITESRIFGSGDSTKLYDDPNVRQLWEIEEDFINRCQGDAAHWDSLRDAYDDMDTVRILTILRYSQAEYDSISTLLVSTATQVMSDHPEILPLSENGYCEPCQGGGIFDVYVAAPPTPVSYSSLKDEQKDTDCAWVGYTACLIACSATTPIIYWACAYVCVCSFCEGDLVEEICM